MAKQPMEESPVGTSFTCDPDGEGCWCIWARRTRRQCSCDCSYHGNRVHQTMLRWDGSQVRMGWR